MRQFRVADTDGIVGLPFALGHDHHQQQHDSLGEVRGGEEIRVGGRGSSERERERERERVQRGCRLHAQRAYGPREGGSEFQKLRTFAFW